MYRKIILTLVIISLVFALEPLVSDAEIFDKFQDFMKEYEKKYTSIEEYMARYQVFKSNYRKMEGRRGNMNSFVMDVTQFFDLTPQEFRKQYLTLQISILDAFVKPGAMFLSQQTAPDSHNWQDHGAVNPVKNQGNCGSCWAFSTVGNIEGLYAIKNNKLLRFSEQQLVDCDKVDQGCNGGLMENADQYIINAGGLELEKDYAYTGRDGTCKFVKTKVAVEVTGYYKLPYTDEAQIKEYLYTTGPLSVALNAEPLQYYSRGIVDEDASSCDPQGLNHGVTMVGYGNENGKDYWIVKNSWGPTWGEKGYFRIRRGEGTCGINSYVVSAILK